MIYLGVTIYLALIFYDDFVVVIWYILLILILYVICGIIVVIVLIMLFIEFDYWMLILFEYYTLMFFFLVSNNGSSYERGSANIFIIVFRFILGFRVVISNSIMAIGIVLLILGLAKLPMYRLHIWLPKVHVEASILRSMVLAGAVLKLGIIYMWNFGEILGIRVIMIISVVVIYGIIDRKGFAAYSSVLHMTLCVVVGLYIMLLIGYIHIVLSPLIFITVYIIYVISGSRFYIKSGVIILILWMVNFGLPFLGSFFSEVYVMQYGSIIVMVLVVIYLIVGYVIMKSLNMDGKGLFYIPWIVLYVIVM